MIDKNSIKGVIFDYGGTIDTNGVHWGVVLQEAYERFKVPVKVAHFRAAYVHGERTLAVNRIVFPHFTFYDTLLAKITIQFEYLVSKGHLPVNYPCDSTIDSITEYCYSFARDCVNSAIPVLSGLSEKYPLVLVSNFYGNIETVLEDFHLYHFFQHIVESAVVGIRKPDPALFALGVEKLGLSASEVVVIGDSVRKDIHPAQSLGCRTIWLKGEGWGDEEESVAIAGDVTIKNLNDVLTIL